MHLDFIEHHPPTDPAFHWRPFGDSRDADSNFNRSWWSERNFLSGSRLCSIEIDGTEVARVEIDHRPGPTPYRVPVRGLARELHYIEVSQAWLGRGIGTTVVHRLVENLRDARLIASSNSAVGFWSRFTAWDRFDDPDGLPPGWVVFVSRVPG